MSQDALTAWRAAHAEAARAYEFWRLSHDPRDYFAYRAAQDLEDAAQDELAGRAKATA
jgi:hypothetical protein